MQNLQSDSFNLIKKGIWLYFFLLIFEGALRKWILPGLSTPLLVVRDPLGLWLIFMALKNRILPFNIYMGGMLFIGIASFYTAIFIGHGSLPVALYGSRIMLIHFPLMFIIGTIFGRKDVIKIGKVTLYISIPMVILLGFQFYSPQSDFVNRGVGGDLKGAGFTGAMGFFRPSGTFSFTNGNALFFSFVTPYILYFWLSNKNISKLILSIATLALLLSIPLSISRALLFQIVISILFSFIAITRKPEYMGKMLLTILVGFGALTILSQTSYFATATEVFTSRFTTANKHEGGLESVFFDRFLGGLIGAITNSNQIPFWGYGTGMGTNVGSMLLTGTTTFLISEAEWGRLVGELGIIMGFGAILLRIGIILKITIASFSHVLKGDLLPWILLSFGFITILQSQWAQPTSLGFSTLIGGLLIACFNESEEEMLLSSDLI
ncbi:hypothetical protein [Cognataquiflexum rubidum]|uniref:hypothetical protein n=1 Tax=Cognataquiflexum rubidum TaxID=2922273 RepID=UPI001F13AE76|nr:hypothetical protein [Cognataquiflexum rubidum]MCH6234038.1 hypothetical protein [Cognataquiflexum rubidum]